MAQSLFEESLYPEVQGFPALFDGDVSGMELPVAQVLIDTTVPYLESPFDYRVLPEQDAEAVPGARVRVNFKNREVAGFIRSRKARSEFLGELKPLGPVVSGFPVVSPEIFELCEALADRYAGIVPDVLRLAVPARAARVEAQFEPPTEGPVSWLEDLPEPDVSAFELYQNGPEFLADLAEGAAARGVLTVLPAAETASWSDLLALALVTSARAGRGAIAVVPDAKSLALLEESLGKLVEKSDWARFTAHDTPSDRYRAYLEVRCGRVGIVVGTRTAAYAPVHHLGFVACWDDGDSNLIEQQPPYIHARDILLLRAQRQDAAALMLAYGMSSESARLVKARWASLLAPARQELRQYTPRVMATGDDYQLARDPLAAVARIPHVAFEVAKNALQVGPVLVQVARSGYVPHLSCQRCRMSARCTYCAGPLQVASSAQLPGCGWCGKPAVAWSCGACSYERWRMSTKGALRTAEELGRAFPDVPVISSSGEHVKNRVEPVPSLVVATPGGEPVVEGGYAAALLLDAESMLQRDSLRAPEQALRRWFNAASLVRPFSAGGRVVTTASESAALAALVRWDPWGFAHAELEERAQLLLPPAARTAALTGEEKAVQAFLKELVLPESVRVVGPHPLEDATGYYESNGTEEGLYRAILFFTYAEASRVTPLLRAARAKLAAARTTSPVQVRCDGLDIL